GGDLDRRALRDRVGPAPARQPAPPGRRAAPAAVVAVLRVSRRAVHVRADPLHAVHLLPVLTPRAVRRFLRHLAAFSIPPALALLAGEGVLQGSGEAWPIDRVISFQREHPRSLFLRAVDQLFYASKYRGVLAHAPSVLVVGSSRTMKFRAGMFGDRAAAFFNAGGMVNSLDDLEDFTVSFPPPRPPDVLIVGVALWWLNERVPPSYRFAREIARGGTWTFDEHILALRWLLQRPRTLASELTSLVTRAKPEE